MQKIDCICLALNLEQRLYSCLPTSERNGSQIRKGILCDLVNMFLPVFVHVPLNVRKTAMRHRTFARFICLYLTSR